ncbi:MAG TPA: alpha amylase family protein [bacterium]
MKKYFILLAALLIFADSASASPQGEKLAVLWCDPLLNIRDITSRAGISNIISKAEDAGFGAIALGVKAVSGEVIYPSKVAPRLLQWDGYSVPLDLDPVKIFLEEAKRRQLQIYAVFSVFSEGHNTERRGPIFDERSNWESQVYVVDEEEPKVIPITQWESGSAAFANPFLSEVQTYEIAVVKEFLQEYSVDGIIFDKVRFSGIESDFSDFSRSQFEGYLAQSGKRLQWWPDDVMQWNRRDGEWNVVPGMYYKEWIEFRSKTIHDFLSRLTKEIKGIDPTLPIGNFVGGWYTTYYEYGVNWASEDNFPEGDWVSQDYQKTAIASLLNYLIVGCYYPRITTVESEQAGADWWMSIEGAAMVSMDVVSNVCPVYGAILVDLFKTDGEKFKSALTTVINLTNGLYVYDNSSIERYGLWDEIAAVLIAQD